MRNVRDGQLSISVRAGRSLMVSVCKKKRFHHFCDVTGAQVVTWPEVELDPLMYNFTRDVTVAPRPPHSSYHSTAAINRRICNSYGNEIKIYNTHVLYLINGSDKRCLIYQGKICNIMYFIVIKEEILAKV